MEKIVIISAVALLLLFGCAGQPQPPAQNAPAPQPQTTPPAPSSNQPSPPAKSASDSLRDLLVLQDSAQYRVNYSMSVTGFNFSFVGYARGSDRRTDSSAMGESRTYKLAGVSYTCTRQDDAWSCKKSTGTSVSLFPNVNKDSMSNFTVTGMPGREITGVSAKCFNLVGSWATMDYCLSAEGAPLYMSANTSSVNDTPVPVVMIATSYTTQVSDSDFELPAQAG